MPHDPHNDGGVAGSNLLPWSLANSEESSLDSIAAMRKSKNREAAKKSRAKKKAEANILQYSNDRVVKENNKLKLDNAALRAENQVLKRQLNYFENLFAKKNTQQVAHHVSHFEQYSSATHTQSRSSAGSVINGEEMVTHQRRPTAREYRGDNRPPSACAASNDLEEEGEISFVLERNPSASPTGNKLGLFSLALIMCICCFSSFFGP